MDIKTFKEKLFNKAMENGFSDCELYYSNSKSIKISVFKGDIENFQNAASGGVSFRGFFDGKIGYSYVEKIDDSIVDNLIKYAKENAEIINEEEKEEIYIGDKDYKEVKTYYEDLEKIEVDTLIEKCLEMEKSVFDYDERITGCNYCVISKVSGETYIANTKGLELNKKGNYIFAYTNALAKDGEDIKSGMEVFAGFDINEINPKEIGRKASKKAISSLGAKSLKSGKYNIVFENECFTNLLSCFLGNFYAENIQKGFSLLKGKLNKQIASPLITVLDEPLMEKGYSSSSFDSEGVACFNKTIIENGILKTYLYNLKTAKKDGVKSTGNGFKDSYKGKISTSFTNFYIKNGEKTLYEILQNASNGIYVTDLSGLHSGVNSISGDFSLLSEGFLIENGKITLPIEQITIAGNFYEMFKNIKDIASDLKFSTSGIGSPSIYIGELMVAGE